MRALSVIAFFLMSCGGAALAQTQGDTAPFYYLPEIPTALVLSGLIDFRSPLAFKRALQEHPETQAIILQSDGGSVQAALLIAEEIHERKLQTLIPEKSLCASACSFVFFAGVERLALGQLGVHQISGSEDIEAAQLNLSDVIETLSKYNVSAEVITRMLRTPPNDIYIFSDAEIASLGINRTSASTDQQSAANVPAAPVPASVTTQPILNGAEENENKAKQFVLGLVTASSLPKADLLSLASNVYSDSVTFYGKSRSKAEVLADKETYADRWPMRSSVVHPDSIVSSCSVTVCRVSGVYDWQVFDPKRNRRAAGSAEFVYDIQMAGVLRVVNEDGKIISRDKSLKSAH